MTDTAHFRFEWTPSMQDLETSVVARRRATRALLMDRLGGLVFVLLGLSAVASSTAFGLGMMALGLLQATGLWGRGYRWFFAWRRNPHLFQPLVETIGPDVVTSIQGGTTHTWQWAHWRSLIVLDDVMILYTAPKGLGESFLLPQRGLEDPSRWDAAVALVASRVLLHPRSPRKPAVGALTPTT